MADLPPPHHIADLLKDELVHLKPAPIILHRAPAQLEGYIGDDDMEEDEEKDPKEDPKEEPIEQLVPKPNNMDGFALHPLPQPKGNMNRWLIEDDDDELEEDRVGDDDEEEMEMDENDEEVINPYEEVDPLNRPPPISDEESEFAPPVVPIFDANDELVPTIIQFGGNLHVGESSSTGALLAALDAAVRKNSSEYSKMMKFVEGLSKQFNEFKEQSLQAERLSHWEAWVRERIPKGLRFQEEPPIHPAFVPCSDDPYAMVRDATITSKDDVGDDTTTPTDS
ncbi:hypothetical protein Tco_0876152 [Tanacetum coccineum]|uniref:Uncharacterized protein n=1 Tax=Tanacetum coccineum TaxID=301880 RepID=A0ABQ5BUB4_9ASTR